MKWKFWEKDLVAPPQIITPQEESRVLSLPGQPVLLKKMKWVVDRQTGKIGIITAMDASGMVDVDMVQEDGTTYATCRTQVGNVRIAKLDEIPLCRRPANPAMAANLGYF